MAFSQGVPIAAAEGVGHQRLRSPPPPVAEKDTRAPGTPNQKAILKGNLKRPRAPSSASDRSPSRSQVRKVRFVDPEATPEVDKGLAEKGPSNFTPWWLKQRQQEKGQGRKGKQKGKKKGKQ